MATNEALDAAISAVERRAAAMQPQQDDLIGLLDDYNTMRDKLKESSGKRQVNALPYLQPNTQRLVCMAEASVGRTRTAIAELAKSRWKLDKHSFADAFDYQTLISQDFISELRTLLGATTCNWDHAYCAILTARNDRISRATARSGISSSRTWIRQDIKDAAKKLGIEKTSASQRKKKRKLDTPQSSVSRKSRSSSLVSEGSIEVARSRDTTLPEFDDSQFLVAGATSDCGTDDDAPHPLPSSPSAHNPLRTTEIGPESSATAAEDAKDGTSRGCPNNLHGAQNDDAKTSVVEADISLPDSVAVIAQAPSPPLTSLSVQELPRLSASGEFVPTSPQFDPIFDQSPTGPVCPMITIRDDDDAQDRRASPDHSHDEDLEALRQLEGPKWVDSRVMSAVLRRIAPSNVRYLDVGDIKHLTDAREERRLYSIPPGTTRVLAPFLIANCHWVMLSLDLRENVATIYNPLPEKVPVPDGSSIARRVAASMALDWEGQGWSFLQGSTHPHQKDGNSCGPHVLVNALCLIAGVPAPPTIDAGLWRHVFQILISLDKGDIQPPVRPDYPAKPGATLPDIMKEHKEMQGRMERFQADVRFSKEVISNVHGQISDELRASLEAEEKAHEEFTARVAALEALQRSTSIRARAGDDALMQGLKSTVDAAGMEKKKSSGTRTVLQFQKDSVSRVFEAVRATYDEVNSDGYRPLSLQRALVQKMEEAEKDVTMCKEYLEGL